MGKRQSRQNTSKPNGFTATPTTEDNILSKKPKLDNGPIIPKNDTQRKYINMIRHNKVIISEGAAGSGKTYIACKMAAQALINGDIDTIYVVRPLVEACPEGEALGTLPGEIHMRLYPIFGAQMQILEDVLGKTFVEYLIKIGKISLMPLSIMRGRSISNSFILCTEMQNCAEASMKLLLTRIGEGTTLCIDGDLSQRDIQVSGLEDLISKVTNNPNDEVGIIRFTDEDCVRSGVCKYFLDVYKQK